MWTRKWEENQTGGPGDGKMARRADQEMGRGPRGHTRRWEEGQVGGPGDGKRTRWQKMGKVI